MLHQWETLTADQRMSPEVHRFLQLEIEWCICPQTRTKYHSALKPTIEMVFRDGSKLNGNGTARRTEQKAAQMEEALFVSWHALWLPTSDRPYWSFGVDTGDLLLRALGRQRSAHGLHHKLEFSKCWNGADFSNQYLDCADFSGMHLSDSNFEDTRLSGTRFVDCELNNSNFHQAELDTADFSYATLKGARLSGALLLYTRFYRSDLTAAIINDSLADDAYFEGADLTGASFRNASLGEANFRHSKLNRTMFDNANLKGAAFFDSDGLGVDDWSE